MLSDRDMAEILIGEMGSLLLLLSDRDMPEEFLIGKIKGITVVVASRMKIH
jgi:hypothetical protein